jgi:tetratricopeptide (TPR) repeat protein
MTDDPRLADLLAQWESGQRRGQPVRPEDLCHDAPELLPRLREGIQRLETLAAGTDPRTPAALPTEVQAAPGDGADDDPVALAASGVRYSDLRFHARGGLGQVFKAHDSELNRPLAVKGILAERAAHPDARRRFQQEAEITARLEHPGVVPVYGLVHGADGRPYYAMRFIQGESLLQAITQFHRADNPSRDPGERSLALRQLLARFVAVCNTMAYAHSRGIIHRDLKPDNVMLGRYGETLVVDWGLAKPVGRTEADRRGGEETLLPSDSGNSDQTISGRALGTPAYMSPEQAAGRWDVVGPTSDLYSLGATLYCLLTGQTPFQGQGAAEVLQKVQRGLFARPREVKPQVPPALEAVCLKAMASEPEQRYLTAQELAADIEAWLADEPVRARPEPWTERTQRWLKRRRALVVAGTVALVAASICWGVIERTRTAYETQTAAQVNHELGRAASLRDGARDVPLTDPEKRKESARAWDEALAAAEKAETTLVAGLANEETRRRVADQLPAIRAEASAGARDRSMVDRLEAARELRAVLTDEDLDRTNPKAVIVFGHAAAEGYAAAFRDYGIDVLTLEPEEAARRIREQAIRVPMALALDDWLALEFGTPEARRLFQVSSAADPDPFRNRLRAAVAGEDHAALRQLAREAEALDLPVPAALLLADGMHLTGHLNEAVAVLRRTQRRHRDDFWVNDILGVYLFAYDPLQVEEAGRCFAAAMARRPDSYPVHDNLGLVLSWQCRWPEAIEEYETAIRLRGEFFRASLDLSGAWEQQGQLDRAIAICEDVLRRKPTFAYALYQLASYRLEKGDIPQAVALARKALDLRPNWPMAHQCLGAALLRNGQVAEAITACRRAVELSPNIPEARVTLAYAYLQQQAPDKALKELEEGLRARPHDLGLHSALGSVHAQQRKWKEAVADHRRAVALRPNAWQNHLLLGDVLLQAGDVDEAIAAFQEGLRVNPEATELYSRLGGAYWKKRDYRKAADAQREAVRRDEGNAYYRAALGNDLRLDGQYAESVAALHKALQHRPAYSWALNELGLSLHELGQLDQAVAAYDRALRLQPTDAVLHANRGRSLDILGRLDEAIAEFQQAVKLNARFEAAYSDLGSALGRRGRFEEARAALVKAQTLSKPGGGSPSSYDVALRLCERLRALEAKQADVLAGKIHASTPTENLDLALFCYYKDQPRPAVEHFARAFQADSSLAGRSGIRVTAAGAAVRAAAQGGGAEATRLRGQALEWLLAELADRQRHASGQKPAERRRTLWDVVRWSHCPSLTGVRDAVALAVLPAEERSAWQAFWTEVDGLVKGWGKGDEPEPLAH